MALRSRSDIIRSCFAAYGTKDRQVLEDLLSEDFRFTSPYDDRIDKTTYFERCWPNSDLIKSHIIERIFENGDEAFVLYQCLTHEGNAFRNTEHFRFDGDRVREIDVYFGASYRDGVFVRQE
jgi:ketosteroid isomerase-like protein